MEKLIELSNAGVKVVLWGPMFNYPACWRLNLEKVSDGTKLEIDGKGDTPVEAINEAYDRWVRATGKGMPELSLRQIEHIVPPAPSFMSPFDDDSVPF